MFNHTCKFPKYSKTIKIIINNAAVDLYFVNKNNGIIISIDKMSKKFAKYYWHKNAGYGTKDHLRAIKKFGITKHHRKTFNPIHNILSLK